MGEAETQCQSTAMIGFFQVGIMMILCLESRGSFWLKEFPYPFCYVTAHEWALGSMLWRTESFITCFLLYTAKALMVHFKHWTEQWGFFRSCPEICQCNFHKKLSRLLVYLLPVFPCSSNHTSCSFIDIILKSALCLCFFGPTPISFNLVVDVLRASETIEVGGMEGRFHKLILAKKMNALVWLRSLNRS